LAAVAVRLPTGPVYMSLYLRSVAGILAAQGAFLVLVGPWAFGGGALVVRRDGACGPRRGPAPLAVGLPQTV